MKIRFNRILTYLCAVMMTVCILFTYAGAESDPATPTDLEPQETGEAVESLEVMITKVLKVGESWSGTMKKTKPAILKLDIAAPQTIYILAEGKDVWFTAEKSDRTTDKPTRTLTDKETNEGVITLSAEEGSYLITAGPVEPNLMAKATISVMNEKDYEAWEKAKEEADAESQEEMQAEEAETQNEETEASEDAEATEDEETADETEPSEKAEAAENEEAADETGTPEETETSEETEAAANQEATDEENETTDAADEGNKPEESEDKKSEPADAEDEVNDSAEAATEDANEDEKEPKSETVERSIKVDVNWDVPNPVVGDTAHFDAILYGYEGLNYSIQWQYSLDDETWHDIPGATDKNYSFIVTEENNLYYWRILVYLEENQES